MDDVDALPVELGGEVLDWTADDRDVELAAGLVGQLAARGDDLVAGPLMTATWSSPPVSSASWRPAVTTS
ncbi:hypothetical protein C492_04108 [Natronococcus jeotgali DSM 18795]|uniref:Uncharacterized protein n=1 Tax=Natronococcus jeotgali DSM 18795 TaxID=1227498 RepID=L9XUH6_9EURY|nr:hypothetical protein C492_04108 [Natronococcus jeotgali DSM 18795]